jgi:sigma-54 dependent transcriptional regulator, acetoin dehydrogenase operon transcriptional activator AcoR
MGLTPSAFRSLLQYAWPGNVRQLNNVCLTLVTHAPAGAWIDVTDLHRLRPEILAGPRNPNPEAFLEDENVAYGDAIRAFRKKLILDRLRRHGNNVSSASASLGISEPTFYRYWTDAKRTP